MITDTVFHASCNHQGNVIVVLGMQRIKLYIPLNYIYVGQLPIYLTVEFTRVGARIACYCKKQYFISGLQRISRMQISINFFLVFLNVMRIINWMTYPELFQIISSVHCCRIFSLLNINKILYFYYNVEEYGFQGSVRNYA